jgi:hypothetical protein
VPCRSFSGRSSQSRTLAAGAAAAQRRQRQQRRVRCLLRVARRPVRCVHEDGVTGVRSAVQPLRKPRDRSTSWFCSLKRRNIPTSAPFSVLRRGCCKHKGNVGITPKGQVTNAQQRKRTQRRCEGQLPQRDSDSNSDMWPCDGHMSQGAQSHKGSLSLCNRHLYKGKVVYYMRVRAL